MSKFIALLVVLAMVAFGFYITTHPIQYQAGLLLLEHWADVQNAPVQTATIEPVTISNSSNLINYSQECLDKFSACRDKFQSEYYIQIQYETIFIEDGAEFSISSPQEFIVYCKYGTLQLPEDLTC